MDEFAMGSSTETSAYGITKIQKICHEWPEDRLADQRLLFLAIWYCLRSAPDTGGSIRQPAGFCGLWD